VQLQTQGVAAKEKLDLQTKKEGKKKDTHIGFHNDSAVSHLQGKTKTERYIEKGRGPAIAGDQPWGGGGVFGGGEGGGGVGWYQDFARDRKKP